MKIFSIIWNIICLVFAVFIMIASENQNKNEDFLMIAMIYSLLWGIILFIRGLYLILYIPFSVEMVKFRQKEWECAFSFTMSIIVFFISLFAIAKETPMPIKNTMIALIVWAVGRMLFEVSKKRKVEALPDSKKDEIELPKKKNPSQKWMEWAKNEEEREKARIENAKQQQRKKEEERQQEIEKLAQLKKRQLDFLEKSIVKEEKDGIVSWYYIPINNEESLEFQEKSIEFQTSVRDGHLAKGNTQVYCKLWLTDHASMYNITFPKQGILKLGGSIIGYKYVVSPNGLIASLDTSEHTIAEYEKEEQSKIIQRHNEERERIARRQQEEEEREKEKIRQKLLKQKKQRELERKVQQEMIDSGELAMEGTKRRHIPHSVVSEVYRRDGARCVICGSMENLQLDHIIPFSKGGADTAENLQILCQKCNLEKSNKI